MPFRQRWGGAREWGELGGVRIQCFWLLTSSDHGVKNMTVCILSLETLLATPVLACIAGEGGQGYQLLP